MSTHKILKIKPKNIEIFKKNDDYYDYLHKGHLGFVGRDGLIDIWSDESLNCGYVFKILSSIEDKLKYAIASLCGNTITVNGEMKPITTPLQTEKNLKKILSVANELYKSDFKRAATGFKFPNAFVRTRKYHHEVIDDFKGVIADDSKGLLKAFLTKEGIDIAEFVSNPLYVVITDTKESTYEKYKELKLIDEDVIVEEFTI